MTVDTLATKVFLMGLSEAVTYYFVIFHEISYGLDQ